VVSATAGGQDARGAIQHCMVEITPTGTVAINAIVCKTMGQEIVFVSCRVYRIHAKHTHISYITQNFIGIANERIIRSTQFCM
jgi:hypothetical protein